MDKNRWNSRFLMIILVLLLMIFPFTPFSRYKSLASPQKVNFNGISAHSISRDLSEIRVAYYNGAGAMPDANLFLPYLFDWMECGITAVRGEDIKNGILGNFDVLVWPGGHYPAYWTEMGLEGKSKIQDFVGAGPLPPKKS